MNLLSPYASNSSPVRRGASLAILFLATLLLQSSARGADIVWTNTATTANGGWAVASNWQPNKVPGASDTVFIDRPGTYTVSINTTSTVAALNLGANSGVQSLSILGTGRIILNGPALGKTTNGVLQLNGGTLDGPGSFVLSGPLQWNGGTLTGGGLLQVGNYSYIKVGGDAHIISHTLVNTSLMTWFSGTLNTQTGSVISNMPGAVFVISNDVSIYCGTTKGAFVNQGTLRKVNGARNSMAGIGDVFTNLGVVESLVGRLGFGGGGVNSGSNWVAAGASLRFTGGTNLLTASSIIAGPGNVSFTQSSTFIDGVYAPTGTNELTWYGYAFFRRPVLALPNLHLSGNTAAEFLTGAKVTIQELALDGGTIAGSDELAVNHLTWLGGGFEGSGAVYLNDGQINGSTLNLFNRRLIVLGDLTWKSGMLNTGLGSVFSNAPSGTFTLEDGAGGTLYDSGDAPRGTIANAGLMRKVGAPGKVTYFNDFILNYGTLEVNSGWFRCFQPYTNFAGELRLFAGSTFEPRAACRLEGGTLTGDGFVLGDVYNSGVVDPGRPVGQLLIQGKYVQQPSGRLNIDLAGVGSHDVLKLTNAQSTATLNGTVRASFVNGFMPAPQNKFVFLSGSRSGNFTSLEHPSWVAMTLDYAATNVTMRVTNVAPVPTIASLKLHWKFTGEDMEGNSIWRLYPQLTWPAMAGTLYRIYHAPSLSGPQDPIWSGWPSEPPLNLPSYITATGAVMIADGPSIGTRVQKRLPPEMIENSEPAHFYRVAFGP